MDVSVGIDALSYVDTTLSRMVEFRVSTRAFRSTYFGEPPCIIVTLNPMRGLNIIQGVTQTPISTRMSIWIKYAGNKSQMYAGSYLFSFSMKSYPCWLHGPTGLKERVCFGFLVGTPNLLHRNQHDGHNSTYWHRYQ